MEPREIDIDNSISVLGMANQKPNVNGKDRAILSDSQPLVSIDWKPGLASREDEPSDKAWHHKTDSVHYSSDTDSAAGPTPGPTPGSHQMAVKAVARRRPKGICYAQKEPRIDIQESYLGG